MENSHPTQFEVMFSSSNEESGRQQHWESPSIDGHSSGTRFANMIVEGVLVWMKPIHNQWHTFWNAHVVLCIIMLTLRFLRTTSINHLACQVITLPRMRGHKMTQLHSRYFDHINAQVLCCGVGSIPRTPADSLRTRALLGLMELHGSKTATLASAKKFHVAPFVINQLHRLWNAIPHNSNLNGIHGSYTFDQLHCMDLGVIQ